MYYTAINGHSGAIGQLAQPTTLTAPIVRHFTCSAEKMAEIERLIGQSFTEQQVRETITAAAGEGAMIATQAAAKLRSSAAPATLESLFLDCFGVGRKHVPSWRPAGQSWNVGGVVRTRFERAARTLTDGYVHYSCHEAKANAVKLAAGKYRIGLGPDFWKEWKNGSISSPPSFLLGAALIIYFGPMMTGRIGAPKTVSVYSYLRFALTLAGLELPLWVSAPGTWVPPTAKTPAPATPPAPGTGQSGAKTSDLDAARADAEAEKKRFEEARRRHEERLKPLPVGTFPVKVLKPAGLNTTTRVGSKTASLIQTTLDRSRALRPYIENKLNRVFIPNGFKIHNTDAEFNSAYTTLHNLVIPFGSQEERDLEKARGFFHAATKQIHLRPTANTGYALHEAIHKFADRGFRPVLGGFLDEGVTQYFTDMVLREQTLDPMTHHYGKQLACAQHLVRAFTHDVVARAFFQGGASLNQLMQQVLSRLRVDMATLVRLRTDGALCERILRLNP